nr:ATP-binding protein [Methanococcoides sp. NM1]
MSELWKNGYDAYADNLSCDLYLKGYRDLKAPLFTLSDDGTGMSAEDIEKKWIVLGTDSKTRGMALLTEDDRLGKPPRIPMGEKGIGRLSVSYLGLKMLMLTKKKGMKCSALFMDWEILDNFNLYLDDINIPIKEISSSSLLKEKFSELVEEFKNNLSNGDWHEHRHLKDKILDNLDKLIIPNFLLEDLESHFFNNEDHGTIFIIFDPHEQLIDLSRGDTIEIKDDATTNYLRFSLSGIYNAFKDKQIFETSFWIHDIAGKYNLIDKQDFFERDDIFAADHWVTGSFNEEGFFTGDVQIYNEHFKHTFRPRRQPGKTPYGQFNIEFGFIEGDSKNSNVSREKWDVLKRKAGKFGGIYVYRDEFRVLPYGRSDHDFLKFEERRSLSATYYQFSRRRVFGYIEIKRDSNPKLTDKAGREGFIVNKAFREFQADLIDFFIDFSVRFLRTINVDERHKGTNPTLRQEQVELIRKRNERLLKAEKKRSKITTTSFKRDLNENTQTIDDLASEMDILYDKLNEENSKDVLTYNNVSSLIVDLKNKKSELNKLKISKPQRIELTDSQTNKYADYREKYDQVLSISLKCNDLISETQKKLSHENLKIEFENQYQFFKDDVESMVKGYNSRFANKVEELGSLLKNEIKQSGELYAEKTGHLIISGTENKAEVKNRIEMLETIHDSLMDEIEDKYSSFIKHVEGLNFDIDDDLLVGWYKEQYEKINEKVEALHELAQVGIAIEIIDHQFNVLYSEMSAAIDFFKRFSDEKPEIKYNYNQLRRSFEHLESNHKLLMPLYRTRRRSKTEIKGSDIEKYINNFFMNNFERDNITFTVDPSFKEYSFYSYESIIMPVFINVINNAMYWLIPSKDRKIHITNKFDKILIQNSGDKIAPAYLEKIFSLFFTKKPGGRGIGLYLAKTNLRSIGYDIYATNDKNLNTLNGACFVIQKFEKELVDNGF